MTMTYQQQFVLDGVAGRDAIMNLTARHNRCYSDGDSDGWIQHSATPVPISPATVRCSLIWARPSTAVGGEWSPSTRDHRRRHQRDSALRRVTFCCCGGRCCHPASHWNVPGSTRLRTWRLVLHFP